MAVGTLVNIWAIGPVLFLSFTVFAIFFNFLWKEGGVASRVAALIFSTMSWLMSSTPTYYVYAYDNFSMAFNSQFLVPQPGTIVNGASDAGTWYYILFVFGIFMILFACVKLIFIAIETGHSEEE